MEERRISIGDTNPNLKLKEFTTKNFKLERLAGTFMKFKTTQVENSIVIDMNCLDELIACLQKAKRDFE